MHLLALLIELTSVHIAGKQIKKPIDIPRPGGKGNKQQRQQGAPSAPAGEEGGRNIRTPARPPSQQPSQQEQGGYGRAVAVLRSSAKVRR